MHGHMNVKQGTDIYSVASTGELITTFEYLVHFAGLVLKKSIIVELPIHMSSLKIA